MPPTAPQGGASSIPRYGTNRSVIGLPARAVALTNSERGDAACDLRWFYRSGLGLASARTEEPLSFGSAGHDAMQDLWGWWAATDAEYDARWFETCVWCALGTSGGTCEKCGGTGLGPVPRAVAKWYADAASSAARFGAPDEDDDEIPERADRLRRVLTGYLQFHGKHPPADLRVVGVEVPIARQIVGPNGKPYAPEVLLYRCDDGGYRFARPDDDTSRIEVSKLPWYYVGILDVILASRATGMLFVGEHKFSKAPETLLQGLTNDPQMDGYCWALEAAAPGLVLPPEIQALVDARGGVPKVGGYLYMVNSSGMQYDPKILKDGSISEAMNRTVPSWRFEAHLDSIVATPETRTRYAPHVAALKARYDSRLYRREPGLVGAIGRSRFEREIYAVAKRTAQMRRDVARVSAPEDVEHAFPRTPVCRIAGGSCSFRGPCASKTVETSQILTSGAFVVSDGQRWFPTATLPLPASPALPEDPIPAKDLPPCPF